MNSELISLYWDMGRQIVEKQQKAKWGSGFIEQLSHDLKAEFPGTSGFSKENLLQMKRFFAFYSGRFKIMEQLVPQTGKPNLEQFVPQNNNGIPYGELCKVPWGHHVLIMKKIKQYDEATFYISETISNNWSRSVLEYQIETNLYKRQGQSVNNFALTLPKPQSDLANQLLKDSIIDATAL